MGSKEFTEWVESRRSSQEPSPVTSFYVDASASNLGNLRQYPVDSHGNIKRRPTTSKKITQSTAGFVSSGVSTEAIEEAIEDFSIRLFQAIDAKDTAMAVELATDTELLFQTAHPCWER